MGFLTYMLKLDCFFMDWKKNNKMRANKMKECMSRKEPERLRHGRHVTDETKETGDMYTCHNVYYDGSCCLTHTGN